jgi:D-glycero-alpha-D-manno-heptose-7-phosphate kinase
MSGRRNASRWERPAPIDGRRWSKVDMGIRQVIEAYRVKASAPCRVDMGGTLDIATFYVPLQAAAPRTVNLALDMRTRVELEPIEADEIRITSRGFAPAAFAPAAAPFQHPLGLFFAIAAHFDVTGIHIHIESASPPRSALGGSSVAAVALVGALAQCREMAGGPGLTRDQIVRRAHLIEESVAGVPCGMQDHLAAAYGGLNTWHWVIEADGLAVGRTPGLTDMAAADLAAHILVAYAGVPHVSRDVNGRWVRGFLAGEQRARWFQIAECVAGFSAALNAGRWRAAAAAMNAETAIRREMTPEVLEPMGETLLAAAAARDCGGRFTGAGGGGCLWAVGERQAIRALRTDWEALLAQHPQAALLPAQPDGSGLRIEILAR